jgi:hypothetical protein
MPGQRPPPRLERLSERGVETDGLRSAEQQDRPGVRHDAGPVPVDGQTRVSPATLLHQKGASWHARILPSGSIILAAQRHLRVAGPTLTSCAMKAPG